MKQRKHTRKESGNLNLEQQTLVNELYWTLVNMTPAEVADLEETHRFVLQSQQKQEAKQKSRFELARVLTAIKKQMIEKEKYALQAQIEALNSL